MAKLPGLSAFTDDHPDVSQARPSPRGRLRDPAPDQNPALRPVASPVETYARPERVPQDDNLNRLSQSLAALNPALASFSDTFKEDREDAIRSRIATTYQNLSSAEALEKMKTDPDAETQVGQKLLGKYQARGAAEELSRELAEKLATSDRDSLDIDAFTREQRAKALAANAGNPYFAQEFDGAFHASVAGAKSKMTEYRVGQEMERRAETVQTGWLGTVDKGVKGGNSAVEIAGAIRDSYGSNRRFLQMSYGDQDRMVVQFVDALRSKMESDPTNADRYMDVARQLVASDRTGADGQKLGTIASSSTIGSQATARIAALEGIYGQIRDRRTADTKFGFTDAATRGELDERALKAFFGDPRNTKAMPETEYRGLLLRNRNAKDALAAQLEAQRAEDAERQQTNALSDQALDAADKGRLWTVGTSTIIGKNGKPREVAADTIISEAVAKQQEREQFMVGREAARMREANKKLPAGQQQTEEQISAAAEEASFNRSVEWFARNGQENPAWKEALKRGALAGETVMQGDTIPPVMAEGFKTYRQLAAKAPNLAHSLTDETGRKFYEVARVLTESGAMDEKKALMTAVEYNRDPSRFDSQTSRQRTEQVAERLRGLNGNALGLAKLLGWGSLAGATRMEDVSVEMQKLADIYVRAGKMSVDDALKAAGEQAGRNFTEINGTAVRTGDRRTPPNFRELANTALKRFSEAHSEKTGVPLGDLSVRPMPNQATSWIIVDKLGIPVTSGPEGIITHDDLRMVDGLNVEKARIRAERKSAGRYTPVEIIPGTGLTFVPPKLGGYSREELAKIEEEGGKIRARARDARLSWREELSRELEASKTTPSAAAVLIDKLPSVDTVRRQVGDAIGMRGRTKPMDAETIARARLKEGLEKAKTSSAKRQERLTGQAVTPAAVDGAPTIPDLSTIARAR